MQVRCIRAFGHHVPGDVAEVPDGASVDPCHFEVISGGAPPSPPGSPDAPPAGGQPPSPASLLAPVLPKEM